MRVLLAFVIVLGGCRDRDVADDAARFDAAADAGDASSSERDGGTNDGGTNDGGANDGGSSDAAASDGGSGDAGPAYALTVEVTTEHEAHGEVVALDGEIACGSECAHDYPSGSRVVLLAKPAYRSTFLGWTGACAGTGECVVRVDHAVEVGATFLGHSPVRLSDTDRDPQVRLRFDRLASEHAVDFGGVRSDTAVEPRSGVFYFEARRLTDALGPYGAGVASASYPLDNATIGQSDQSFGIHTEGGIHSGDQWLGGFAGEASTHYGFVVDYRGAHPIVHVIAKQIDWSINDVVPAIVATRELSAIDRPLFIVFAGMRRTVGPQLELNAGNDTRNFPFHYDVGAILRAGGRGELADALVLGWGDTYAGPPDPAPTIEVSTDRTVAAGTEVTVTATASDGPLSLTSSIEWELLSTPHAAGRLRGSGGSFTFTPREVGVHPARATVVDAIGQIRSALVRITVPGPVASPPAVRLSLDERSGAGIVLSDDGHRAHWTGNGKMGVRANQGCYGCFAYFEAERLVPASNMGVGLVIGEGHLNPYDPSAVPPSMSVNTMGDAWRNLIPFARFDGPAQDHYGFVVDYRGEHPRVFVIVAGAVLREFVLDDVWTAIYPMLYGNPTGHTPPGYDEAINFGETPFRYDPVAALRTYGIDPSGLRLGWGDANGR